MHRADQPLWSQEFNEACRDISTTTDGRTLVAAGTRGVLDYSPNGLRLSCLLPPPRVGGDGHRDNDEGDTVLSVRVIGDGRVVVGLGHSKKILLLNGGGSDSLRSWAESQHLATLPWSPGYLSSYGDHIVAAEARYDDGRSQWNSGDHVTSLNVRDGRPLCLQKREYLIWGLAAAPNVIVTASLNKVLVGGGGGGRGAEAYVVDGFSYDDQLLWRFLAPADESVQGVWGDSATSGALCLSIWKSGYSGGRVAVINSADGAELRPDALSFSSCLMPVRLSLCRNAKSGRLLLVALCWDHTSWQHRTLAAYQPSALDELFS